MCVYVSEFSLSECILVCVCMGDCVCVCTFFVFVSEFSLVYVCIHNSDLQLKTSVNQYYIFNCKLNT